MPDDQDSPGFNPLPYFENDLRVE